MTARGADVHKKVVPADFAAFEDELVSIRRQIHSHPETGFDLPRTTALVAAKLRDWGIDVHEGIGRSGIVGTVAGLHPQEREIGLRADMDALHINETTGLAYASKIPGKMHACGHDGHTTMLLGAARFLAENRDFAGKVHFIFQPAEEGAGGAKAMIEDGLFDRFPCEAVYGMHNLPGLDVGRFEIRAGAFAASPSEFRVTFRGSGGHGGLSPHLASDVTIAQAHFVLALQNVIGRDIPAASPAVISVGSISGGSEASPNVMPSTLVLTGTIRTFDHQTQGTIVRRISDLAAAHATAQRCSAEVSVQSYTPVLMNAPRPTEVAVAAARAIVGHDRVDTNCPLIFGSDDFAEMSSLRPGAFLNIGNGRKLDGSFDALHTPLYDFNDQILPIGCAYWANIVLQELRPGSDLQAPGSQGDPSRF